MLYAASRQIGLIKSSRTLGDAMSYGPKNFTRALVLLLMILPAWPARANLFSLADHEGFHALDERTSSLAADIGTLIAQAPSSAERVRDCLVELSGHLDAFRAQFSELGALVWISSNMVENSDELVVLVTLFGLAQAFMNTLQIDRQAISSAVEKCPEDRGVMAKGQAFLRIYDDAALLVRSTMQRVGANLAQ